MRTRRAAVELLGPALLVVAAGIVGALVSQTNQIYFITALISVATVVAIYVFVGNSGVLSFGHISFFAVGVWAAGVLSVPEAEKPATMPYLFDFLSSTTVGNVPSLLIAAAVGGAFALLVGLPLMRLSGLAAGIATFAVLGITNNILRYYEKIGPGGSFALRARIQRRLARSVSRSTDSASRRSRSRGSWPGLQAACTSTSSRSTSTGSILT